MLAPKELFTNFKLLISNFSYITLSGEINISNNHYEVLITTNAETVEKIKKTSGRFKNTYPKFKVDVVQGISDITLKLFVYRFANTHSDFLDELQYNLSVLLADINFNGDCKIKLNIFGSIDSFNGRCDFRYLNNEQEVRYKIVNSVIFEGLFTKFKFFFGNQKQ